MVIDFSIWSPYEWSNVYSIINHMNVVKLDYNKKNGKRYSWLTKSEEFDGSTVFSTMCHSPLSIPNFLLFQIVVCTPNRRKFQ
jgi:hypothetical protein